ncbi:conserved hypothetical protein [Peptoniphilus harei ACS-146-V-Sch2b]|uniref:Uncharacterized protein n=1 Tax=Peptoniphilus harei ACS-146-V-Sch2b TaxID=908338 RepID=E4KWM1_9FIRM|nr:conserved hypothetical protein [Peptoniphilus harei ACS-146-V-Sch2b]
MKKCKFIKKCKLIKNYKVIKNNKQKKIFSFNLQKLQRLL